MGEKTGFLLVLLIFGVAIIPFMLNGFDKQVKSSKLLSLSNEVQQLVSAEGGVSDKVQNVSDQFREKGVTIEFTDKHGNPITGKVNAGDEVFIQYEFDGFETKNSVVVLRR